MKFEWDERKAALNFRKHGVSFADAANFEFETAMIGVDDDLGYGEERLKAYGFLGRSLHVLVYAERGDVVRVISLRPATRTEKRAYEEYVTNNW